MKVRQLFMVMGLLLAALLGSVVLVLIYWAHRRMRDR